MKPNALYSIVTVLSLFLFLSLYVGPLWVFCCMLCVNHWWEGLTKGGVCFYKDSPQVHGSNIRLLSLPLVPFFLFSFSSFSFDTM